VSVLLLERHLLDDTFRDEYERAVSDLLALMRVAGGFLWADAAESLQEPGTVSIASEWRTDADLDAFCAADAYREFVERNDLRLHEPPMVRRFGPR
jgi:quinol monooxygenase YgiN